MGISNSNRTLLVTGGAGFIGSHFVDAALIAGYKTIVLDKLTYAGSMDHLQNASQHPLYQFVLGDILDSKFLEDCFQEFKPSQLIHFAAESHVDRSIDGPEAFLQTNVVGTFRLLETAKKYFEKLDENQKKDFLFYQISTDEVFGSLQGEEVFHIDDPYRPNSPYSASKAAADLFVRAYHETYRLPILISHCTNNYGPRQHSEKFIPTVIRNCLQGSSIPVYGNGKNQRDWIYVKDHVEGILLALQNGKVGRHYGFSGQQVVSNIDLARQICGVLDEMQPRSHGKKYAELLSFVEDRKGHDFRYALDDSQSEKELGYGKSRKTLRDGLQETIQYYLDKKGTSL